MTNEVAHLFVCVCPSEVSRRPRQKSRRRPGWQELMGGEERNGERCGKSRAEERGRSLGRGGLGPEEGQGPSREKHWGHLGLASHS